MLKVQVSKLGLGFALSFWGMGLLVFGYHSWSVYTDPASTGYTAIYLLPFAMPWINLLPESWFSGALWQPPWVPGWWALVGLNTLLLYLLCGGLSRRA